jgi:hypothetical protein
MVLARDGQRANDNSGATVEMGRPMAVAEQQHSSAQRKGSRHALLTIMPDWHKFQEEIHGIDDNYEVRST